MPSVSDFLPEIICLGIDCVVCGILYSAYYFTNRAVSSIASAAKFDLDNKPHDVSSLKDEISTNPNAIINSDGDKCVPYAIIRGNVQPVSKKLELGSQAADSLQKASSLKNIEGVIQQYSIIEHKKTMSRTGFWYDSERTVYEHTNHVPFYIVPQGLTTRGLFTTNLSDSPCRKVEVIDWSNASILDLDVTKDTFEAAQSGFSDNLMGWMVGDRPKGIQTCEKMLLNGTTLTAIGEIVISKDTGDIKVQSPSTGENYYLIKDTAKGLVKELEKNSRILRNTLLFFGGIGTIILSVAMYRYFTKVKLVRQNERLRLNLEEIIRARQDRGQNSTSSLSNYRETLSDVDTSSNQLETNIEQTSLANRMEADPLAVSPQTCVVCLSEQREVILMNCGHVCVCAGCAMEIMASRPNCPICRANIVQVAPAYIA